jgi:hypothetical protein
MTVKMDSYCRKVGHEVEGNFYITEYNSNCFLSLIILMLKEPVLHNGGNREEYIREVLEVKKEADYLSIMIELRHNDYSLTSSRIIEFKILNKRYANHRYIALFVEKVSKF